MTGNHARWARMEEPADDPERLAIREALAFGKALYDFRTTLGLSVAELATRPSLTEVDIECIEEGGTEPTIPLLRCLAAALNADVHLTAGHGCGAPARREISVRLSSRSGSPSNGTDLCPQFEEHSSFRGNSNVGGTHG